MKKAVLFIAVVMLFTGCTFQTTKHITDRLQPAELYEAYGVKPVDLKARSKCPLPPTINIVNVETREKDYSLINAPGQNWVVNPKELTAGIVEYLKYGFKKSQVVVDDNSSKNMQISFMDAKFLPAVLQRGGEIKIKVYIPEMKYSEIYEAVDWVWASDPIVGAINGVTRKIIDDPKIQDYILCKAEYTDKSLSQKLQELQTALDKGLISEEEYQLKRKELLEKY